MTENGPAERGRSLVVRTVSELRERRAAIRRAEHRVGVVPTMGALHEGHLALIRAAAEENDEVVVSIFVNPTQFNDAADLDAYPRTEDRDVELAQAAGATLLFVPSAAEMYPAGFATSVHVGGVSERWEGATRGASHFDGVALVVTKLLVSVGADTAYFGQKDAQQVAVVRRLAADLNLPTTITALPTVRDVDGLALSSRNARLGTGDRETALSLSRSLQRARDLVAAGERDTARLEAEARRILQDAGAAIEYWAIVDPATFEPLAEVVAGALGIVAARVGPVRLIDNAPLA
ncbi:pantoate--beta-alanine ligase [Microbacterium rhizosphaerae]|uniref:Pantothenate synthetase n=1 Tax=Microbacterium rhizosphaerae TaxID=1678237 RepID=A0ABZ0SIH8_9MICO|nr:pantoate--beta-alanine ligase [Microbacterium rhizosphaerae]WPR88363.1 pantoate--beta-alanine ligase [Microbacterium rhizosphaerae]